MDFWGSVAQQASIEERQPTKSNADEARQRGVGDWTQRAAALEPLLRRARLPGFPHIESLVGPNKYANWVIPGRACVGAFPLEDGVDAQGRGRGGLQKGHEAERRGGVCDCGR